MKTLKEITPFNVGKKAPEVADMIEKYVSCSEDMRSELKKLDSAFAELKSEKTKLENEVESRKESVQKRLEIAQKLNDYEDLKQVVEAIPPEILRAYSTLKVTEKENVI